MSKSKKMQSNKVTNKTNSTSKKCDNCQRTNEANNNSQTDCR